MSDVQAVSHLLLQVQDLERALAFYQGVLGFIERHRGTLADGRLYVNHVQNLGLTTYPPGAEAGRSFDHLAFRCPDGIAAVVARLEAAGVAHDPPGRTPYGLSVYFRDPDGNRIECHDSTGI